MILLFCVLALRPVASISAADQLMDTESSVAAMAEGRNAKRTSRVLRDLGLALVASVAGVIAARALKPGREAGSDQAVPEKSAEPAPSSAGSASRARSSSGWRRDLAVGLVLLALGAVVGWVLAPAQEVRSELAVRENLKATLAGQPPLRPHVIYDFAYTEGAVYAFAEPFDEATEAMLLRTGSTDVETLLAEHRPLRITYPRGIRSPQTQSLSLLRMSLEGNRAKPVQILSIKARITERSTPWAGALVEVRPQGGDDIQKIGFDLDAADLEARIVQDDGTFGTRRYIDEKDLKLEYGEPAAVVVSAVTATCYCEWVIDVTTRSDGKVEKQTINDNGRPFRTTAFAPRYDSEFLWRHAPESGFRKLPPTRRASR